MYSNNKGTAVVPVSLNNQVIAGTDSLYASATVDKATNELILKLINVSAKEQTRSVVVDGVKNLKGRAKLTVLQSDNLDVVNTLDNPTAISPVEKEMTVNNKNFSIPLAPYSFTVIRIKM